MRLDLIAFVVVGLALLLGFVLQFLDLKGRGIVYALGAAGALLGLPTLYRMRRTKLRRHIERRLRRLREQAERLTALEHDFGAETPSLVHARQALERARIDGLRQLAEIEAEGRMPLSDAREYARRLSVVDLEAYFPSGTT
jgi:hypothetical protein